MMAAATSTGRSAGVVVAMGFRYPAPGWAGTLAEAVAGLEPGEARRHMERFCAAVGGLELGAWEELHTRTLDLSPLFVPYVGHAIWGESYRRGEFMADLNRAMAGAGVDPAGELPDHLEPVLRYLAAAADPLPDLVEVADRAVEKMEKELKKAEADNPYRWVLAAARTVTGAAAETGARA